MREKKDYKSVVSHPYQVFNGIFLTLPLDGIRQTGLRVPLLQEACEMGLERGAAPHEILEDFLKGQGKANAEEDAALLFRRSTVSVTNGTRVSSMAIHARCA